MALHFCESFLSNNVVLSLLPLLSNHGNFALKLYQKKHSYLSGGWLFIGRLKFESLSRMIRKEVLTQFITEKLFTNNKLTIYTQASSLCILNNECR